MALHLVVVLYLGALVCVFSSCVVDALVCAQLCTYVPT
jgi:hypothetical protein